MDKRRCTAIVLAAGQGRRMNSSVQKQYLELKGKPVLYYSLQAFQDCPWMDEIILVTGQEEITYCEQLAAQWGFTKVCKVIPGGAQRHDSVYAGLLSCEGTEYVFIHDAARPFLDQGILERAWEAVQECKACAVGVPAKDTIKIADPEGNIAATPERSFVWQIQTPQVFAYSLIRQAHETMRLGDMSRVTDDAMVAECALGCRVRLVMGDYRNIKITTPEDLVIAEAFCTG